MCLFWHSDPIIGSLMRQYFIMQILKNGILDANFE